MRRFRYLLLAGFLLLLAACGKPSGDGSADADRTEAAAEQDTDDKNTIAASSAGKTGKDSEGEEAESQDPLYLDYTVPKAMRSVGSSQSRPTEQGEAEKAARQQAYGAAEAKADEARKQQEALEAAARKKAEEEEAARRKAEEEEAEAQRRAEAEAEAQRKAAEEAGSEILPMPTPEEDPGNALLADAAGKMMTNPAVPEELLEAQDVAFSWTQALYARAGAGDMDGVAAMMEDGTAARDMNKINTVLEKLQEAAERQYICVQCAWQDNGVIYFTVYGFDDGNDVPSGGAFCIADYGSGYVFTEYPLEQVVCPECRGYCRIMDYTCPTCGGIGFYFG